MDYKYADIIITPFSEETADIVSAFLSEIQYDSFEQTDSGLKAYIQSDLYDADALNDTIASMPQSNVTIAYTVHDLEQRDWNEQWEHESFDPVLEREFGIRLNPRMAFGSGSHETTHQIVTVLMSMSFTGQRVLDMGTGTGVLAIAMAKRGAADIVAIDIDEMSVDNARDNFILNIPETPSLTKAQVLLGDAAAIEGTFDTIVANIHKNVLKADMQTYVNHLRKNGTLIISGFFTDDLPEMERTANEHGLLVASTMSENGWAVCVCNYKIRN